MREITAIGLKCRYGGNWKEVRKKEKGKERENRRCGRKRRKR
jgi:hypothetical protein